MRVLILLVSTWALVMAKPETYKEKEDFQFSRSSSDEGSKSGYYGAQRGNMGGNYERAHNMDLLAQHQMSTLVKQVDGELGSGADMRTGNVFTSGLSKGVFGSGNYDLSNLQGRNFHEGHTLGDSESHSSMLSNSGYHGFTSNNARYSSSQSQNARQSSGFRSSGQASSDLMVNNQQAQNLNSGLESEYINQASNQAANNYRYYSQANNHRSSGYEANAENLQSNSDLNTQSRIISGTPRKVYIRPGTKVTIPIASQTYDASHFNALQNSVNSDAELLSNSASRQMGLNKPVSKHYESSYNYRKEWEKHDTQPVVLPTDNPFPRNSEIYDNSQMSASDFQRNLEINNAQSNRVDNAYSNRYNSGSSSASSQHSKYQTEYTADLQNLASSAGSHSADFMQGSNFASDASKIGRVTDDISSHPKSYQSSYSYHKSWERQGDPYVIKPIGTDVEALQRLTAGSGNYGQASSHQYGYSKSQHSLSKCSSECMENGHLRVARSYNTDQYENLPQHQYDQGNLEQESQNEWSNLEDLGQQSQNTWDKLDNLGQQSQNTWDELKDLGQQSQNTWGKLEDLGQHSQNTWDKEENSEQQNQNNWSKLEDLGKQSQNTWNKLDDLGQQSQNTLSKLEDLGQQSQNPWAKPEDSKQQNQNTWSKLDDLGQQSQNTWGKLEDLGQESQNSWDKLENLGQQSQYTWGKLEDLGQQTQNSWDKLENLGQQTQNNWDNLYSPHSSSISYQETQNQQYNLHKVNQASQNYWTSSQHQQTQNLGYISHQEKVDLDKQDQENNMHQNHEAFHESSQTAFYDQKKNQNNYGSFSQNENSYQEHISNTKTEKTAINNLWDKIDKISQDLLSESQTFADIQNYGSQLDKTNSESIIQNSNLYKYEKHIELTTERNLVTTTKKENNKVQNNIVQAEYNKLEQDAGNLNKNHKTQPLDTGRGDISSEDTLIELQPEINNKNRNILKELPKNKTTAEEVKPIIYDDLMNLNVLGLPQNKIPSKHELETDSTTTAMHPKLHTYKHEHEDLEQQSMTSDDFGQQSMTSEDFGQQSLTAKDFGQQSLTSEDFGQQSMTSEDFGQQSMISEDFGQQSMTSKDFEPQSMDQQFIDPSQLQSQTLDDFHLKPQNFENTQQSKQYLESFTHRNDKQHENKLDNLENIGQEQQNSWTPEQNMKQLLNSNDSLAEEYKHTNQLMNKVELNNHKVENIESAYNNPSIPEVPKELTTQKPGFWKSVGNKFTSAKDSVASWFRKT